MNHTAQITRIKVGRRTLEDENFINNWENLDINNLIIPKNKTIFLFGGNTTNRPDAANGNAKIVKSLLNPDHARKTNIYSFMYESEPLRQEGYLLKEYENDALLLFERTFKPLLLDSNGNLKEPKGIEQAFNRIVFAAHCGGCNFVNIIINELYNTLSQKYPPNTAELLINKIQYFAYAPNEMPNHNVNSLFVTPYSDPSYSWSKALCVAETQKVDLDYPKGIIKKLLRAKQLTRLQEVFDLELNKTRAIMFKIGKSTYFIPNRMNPRTNIGDHSIECIAKPQFLNSGTDLEENARISNFASRLFLNEFLNNNIIDSKKAFNIITERVEDSSVESQRVF